MIPKIYFQTPVSYLIVQSSITFLKIVKNFPHCGYKSNKQTNKMIKQQFPSWANNDKELCKQTIPPELLSQHEWMVFSNFLLLEVV